MPDTHEFDCRICGAHLESQQALDEHKRQKHTVQASKDEWRASRPVSDEGIDPDRTL